MSAIKRGADVYRREGRRQDANAIIDLAREGGASVPEPSASTTAGTPVVAFIDHGRWLAECGLNDAVRNRICKNAQFVDTDDPRFFCIVCHNDENDNAWRAVTWPSDTTTIEQPLLLLQVEEQNWVPTEE